MYLRAVTANHLHPKGSRRGGVQPLRITYARTMVAVMAGLLTPPAAAPRPLTIPHSGNQAFFILRANLALNLATLGATTNWQ